LIMEENLEEKLARKTKELEIVQRVALALNASSEFNVCKENSI